MKVQMVRSMRSCLSHAVRELVQQADLNVLREVLPQLMLSQIFADAPPDGALLHQTLPCLVAVEQF